MNVPAWYDIAGPPAAKPILFVHGTRVNRKVWLPQMEALADEYRVLAVDLPGHGALSGIPFQMETAVRDIAALIDHEAHGRALLVGTSLGGYVNLHLAHRHPGKVAALVLSGCSLNILGPIALPFRLGAYLFHVGSERWLIRIHEHLCRRLFPPAIADPIIEAGFHFKAAPDALRAMIGQDILPLVRAFPGPILLLNGQRDRIFRRHEAAFHAASQNARREIIPRGTHRCNLEHPEPFTAALRRFAQSIPW